MDSERDPIVAVTVFKKHFADRLFSQTGTLCDIKHSLNLWHIGHDGVQVLFDDPRVASSRLI